MCTRTLAHDVPPEGKPFHTCIPYKVTQEHHLSAGQLLHTIMGEHALIYRSNLTRSTLLNGSNFSSVRSAGSHMILGTTVGWGSVWEGPAGSAGASVGLLAGGGPGRRAARRGPGRGALLPLARCLLLGRPAAAHQHHRDAHQDHEPLRRPAGRAGCGERATGRGLGHVSEVSRHDFGGFTWFLGKRVHKILIILKF